MNFHPQCQEALGQTVAASCSARTSRTSVDQHPGTSLQADSAAFSKFQNTFIDLMSVVTYAELSAGLEIQTTNLEQD
jgi:hypothetical protein